MTLNILFINDSSSNPNWGDRAAAMSLKQMIADCGARIQATITEDDLRDSAFFSESSRADDAAKAHRSLKDRLRPLVPPAVLKFREKVILKFGLLDDQDPGFIPATADDLEACAIALKVEDGNLAALRSAIMACDIVMIHGNGGMFGNGIIPRTKLFLAYAAKRAFGKPAVLINHTAELDHPNLDRMAAIVYPMLDDVTYREQISERRCKGRWPGRYVADSAFLFEPLDRKTFQSAASRPHYYSVWPDHADFDPAHPFICVGGSSVLSYDDRWPPLDLIRQFAKLAEHLKSVYDGQIVLTASDRIDEPVMRAVATRLDLPLIGLATPVQQAVDIVGNADAYIGGRWHVGMFALRGGTPIVPLSSKTFKMPALIEMSGLPDTVFDATQVERHAEAIGRRLVDVLNEGTALRQRLRDWGASQADNCREHLRILERLPG